MAMERSTSVAPFFRWRGQPPEPTCCPRAEPIPSPCFSCLWPVSWQGGLLGRLALRRRLASLATSGPSVGLSAWRFPPRVLRLGPVPRPIRPGTSRQRTGKSGHARLFGVPLDVTPETKVPTDPAHAVRYWFLSAGSWSVVRGAGRAKYLKRPRAPPALTTEPAAYVFNGLAVGPTNEGAARRQPVDAMAIGSWNAEPLARFAPRRVVRGATLSLCRRDA